MKSMTGYGTAEGKVGKGRLSIEIKTINHRFGEVTLRLPPRMGSIEQPLRLAVSERFTRGKVEVYMKEKSPLLGGAQLTVDVAMARKYKAYVDRLHRELGLSGSENFLQYVDIERFIHIEEAEGSYTRLWKQIAILLKRAMDQVDKMRQQEGKHLAQDQRKRLSMLVSLTKQIRQLSSRNIDQHIHRLRKRLAGNGEPLDEQRLHTEAAYLGGRQDIVEELTRLESHVQQYVLLLKESGAVGRKLDFLLQEMNREINTVASKAADAEISRLVVDCKAELERLREQVQNVE